MKWLISIAVTVLFGLVTIMINAHRELSKKHSNDVSHLHAKIDGVKDSYVRRDDFAEFKREMTKTLDRIEDKQDQLLKLVKHN